ncbi:MAG: ABC transporter ATP-binding protein [Phycisphaerae bacterium]|nr:ABC transporter ATP-binding protein [Phycisphaerae bacterium]
MIAVILIATLWGGGLGMLLPGMKVLIAPEGLHGWAWNSLTQDHMQVQAVVRKIPPTMREDLNLPIEAIDIVDVTKDGAAAEGGILVNEWIVGVSVPDDKQMFSVSGEAMMRKLALTSAGANVRLLVFDSQTRKTTSKIVQMHKVSTSSRLLGQLAQKIPEPETRSQRFPIFLWLLGIVAVMTILRNLLRFIQEYLVETAVLKGMIDLRKDCYNSVLRQPVTFFAQEGTTDTMSRFIQDTGELSRAQMTLFGKTLVEPAKAVASVSLAFFLSWELTLVAMVGGPLTYIIIRKFGKIMKRSTKRALESWADMLAVLEETLTGIRVVKAYTMETSERKRFFAVNRKLYKQQRRITRTRAATAPTVEALGIIAAVAAAGGAGYLVFSGKMDTEKFMAWMACLAAMFDPVRKLSKVVTRFQRGDAAAERIFEMQERPQEKRIPGAPMLPRLTQSLELRDVSYSYPNTETFAVDNVNLTIKSGQTVAIVGPNGSGKTTMVSLIPRLLEATSGKILIDGLDAETHSLRSLRRQIGIVTQDNVIFNATIGENISYGLRKTNDADVLDAAKKAYVDEFVCELPDGYDTMVGQRGATLSGGQRQRIAIARAILRDPAILIFDEALSQIDPHSEQRISDAMREFIKGRTTLMIAHRFQTILSADAIVVMDGGKIVDIGTHDELLQRCQLYGHLYKTQFGEA